MLVMLLLDKARGVAPNAIAATHGRWHTLPATDASYWVTMLAAGTLGTAAGDWVADEAGFGTGFGSVVLVAILIVVWFVSDRYGRMAKPWYWLTIVAARTAGTTLGDYLAGRSGLNLGLVVSTIITSVLLAGIVTLWRPRGTARLREA
jgi:uncharacterized membrane-anchored protein